MKMLTAIIKPFKLDDVYEALISDRPYRKALSKKEALKIIKDNSGRQFDPKVVDVLTEVLEKIKV